MTPRPVNRDRLEVLLTQFCVDEGIVLTQNTLDPIVRDVADQLNALKFPEGDPEGDRARDE